MPPTITTANTVGGMEQGVKGCEVRPGRGSPEGSAVYRVPGKLGGPWRPSLWSLKIPLADLTQCRCQPLGTARPHIEPAESALGTRHCGTAQAVCKWRTFTLGAGEGREC